MVSAQQTCWQPLLPTYLGRAQRCMALFMLNCEHICARLGKNRRRRCPPFSARLRYPRPIHATVKLESSPMQVEVHATGRWTDGWRSASSLPGRRIACTFQSMISAQRRTIIVAGASHTYPKRQSEDESRARFLSQRLLRPVKHGCKGF
jgi:hypothetical protein